MTTNLFPDERCERRKPENLLPADENLFAHEMVKQFAPTAMQTIPDVGILPNGFLHRQLTLLTQSFALEPHGARKVKSLVKLLVLQALCARSKEIESGLFATDEFSNGYFHWVCDVLPRLQALSSLAPQELAARTMIVPAMADFPYVGPSLQPFTVGGIAALTWRQQAACRGLLIVPALAPTGNYRPALMRDLRERFRKFFAASGPSRRIYISRAKAARRKVANESELIPVLERHGFETILLEQLTFEEQVKLVGSASVLAGNHGAGLTNMAWMSPGTRVLELRRRGDRENNCYFSLASALDLSYNYLQCNAVSERTSTHAADITVDPQSLDKVLAALT